MDQLVFDEKVAAQLDTFYRSQDVMRRRALVEEALAPEPGDDVLDVGCGPGFYVADLLHRVGDDGTVTGVDPSPAMLGLAERRVGERPNARLLEGTATQLPVEDASVDRVVSVQVFEYLREVDRALGELMRVLRPGGRLVVWDIDWSTLSWHSGDPRRMSRMLQAWDRHLASPTLPRTLLASMRRTGLTDVRREPHVFATTTMDPETFGGAIPLLIRQYLDGLADVDQDEADAWVDDLRELDARGEYAFAVTQFCFTAARPA
jgi:arsenite methyltransferase